DNTGPVLRFFNDLNPLDPETIRVSAVDPHSGLLAGVIQHRLSGTPDWISVPTQIQGAALEGRVDSSAAEPGDHELIAKATDVAGNSSASTTRMDGGPMILSFP